MGETLGSRDFVNAHYELLPKDMKRAFVKVSHDSHDGREEPLPVGDRSRTGPRRVSVASGESSFCILEALGETTCRRVPYKISKRVAEAVTTCTARDTKQILES